MTHLITLKQIDKSTMDSSIYLLVYQYRKDMLNKYDIELKDTWSCICTIWDTGIPTDSDKIKLDYGCHFVREDDEDLIYVSRGCSELDIKIAKIEFAEDDSAAFELKDMILGQNEAEIKHLLDLQLNAYNTMKSHRYLLNTLI